MKHLVLLILVLVLPVAAGAATYSWSDPAGTIHFTDDIGTVPGQYRTKALRQAAGEKTGSVPQPADATAVSMPDRAPAAKAASPAAATAGVEAATPATKFGDRSAAAWQTEFRQLRAELNRIEQERETLRQETGEGKRMLSKQQITDMNRRNKQLNEQYEATRLRFNQLVEQANKTGLPPEFSR